MPSVVLTALLSSALAVSGAEPARPTVVVDPARDQGLPCGANQALIAALSSFDADARVVSATATATTSSPVAQALSASLLELDGHWQLELRGGDGALVLSRAFEQARTDCGEVASASALIIDRYLSDLDWSGGEARVDALDPAKPRPFFSALSVSFGPELRPPFDLSPFGGALSVDARIGTRAFAELSLAGALSQSEQVVISGRDRGTLSAAPFFAWAAGGVCTRRVDGPSACAGALAGTIALRGEASGSLYQQHAQWVALPEAGALVRGALPFAQRWELSATLKVAAPLGAASVAVEGSDAALGTPPVDVALALRIGWRIL